MNIKSAFVILLLLPCVGLAQVKYLGIDAGFFSYDAEIIDHSKIRNYRAAENGLLEQGIRTDYSISYTGIRFEWPLSSKFIAATGVRYAEATADIKKDRWSDAFYYKFRETETLTEYLSLDKITQENRYVNVPLDLRYQPFEPRRFNLYFLLALEMNININHSMSFDFEKKAMEVYKKELANQFDQPERFHGSISLGTGFALGMPGKPQFGMDIMFPSWVVANNSAGIAEPTFGGGMRLFFKHPLTKKS